MRSSEQSGKCFKCSERLRMKEVRGKGELWAASWAVKSEAMTAARGCAGKRTSGLRTARIKGGSSLEP
jgi:hypothetical protein